MRISSILTVLKVTLSLLLIPLAILLGDTVQRILGMIHSARYAFDVSISSVMTNLGTFFLVSILLLIAGWGLLTAILPNPGVGTSPARMKELQTIVLLTLLILLIGVAIIGNYFAQRIYLLSF